MSVLRLKILYVPFFFALMSSLPCSATNVTVDCSKNNSQAFPSITAALNTLDLTGPHFITVSGIEPLSNRRKVR